ncbi:MAG: sigma-70 family RNA polymerase sigma factor [Cryobacterium sp.]|nr:sigma-70 family RNA polymerase sigma factor [Cryobacterium sp.]
MKPFELVVREHSAAVFAVCRVLVGPIDAEDAWSETFLAAISAYPKLKTMDNIRGWLVTIAYHKSMDILRSRTKQNHHENANEVATTQFVHAANHEAIWSEVKSLPERQRLAIAYHYLAGLPHAETAAIIGGTADATRRAASDGLENLRKRLNREDWS